MNGKARQFIKNILGAVGANVARLMISVLLTLVLPKLMGQEEYSYWQLYLFYGTYLAYSSLGWCEGVTLKYGGAHYDELNKPFIIGQIWMLFGYELLFLGGLWLVVSILEIQRVKHILLLLACASAVLDIVRYMVQSVLNTVNRIQDYVRIVLLERLLFAAAACMALLLGFDSALALILSEIIGRGVSMLYSFWGIRDMVCTRPAPGKETLEEAKSEISIGCKLLWALLASQLVIGIIRFAIEQKWGVLQFGQISLTISLSNMIVSCVSAIGVVIFPMIKRMRRDQMERIYTPTRTLLCMGKAYMTEFYVCRHVEFPLWRELLTEGVLMALFMVSGWYGNYLTALGVYALGYAIYLLLEHRTVQAGIQLLKTEMRGNHGE